LGHSFGPISKKFASHRAQIFDQSTRKFVYFTSGGRLSRRAPWARTVVGLSS
jgi:hypothetical protein